MLTPQKIKNTINILMMDFGAHMSQNSELMNTYTKLPRGFNRRVVLPKCKKSTNNAHFLNKTGCGILLKSHIICDTLTNILFFLCQLLENNAKLLVINGASQQFKVYSKPPTNHKLKKINMAYLESQKGALTNWSRLCVSAWNSYKITQMANAVSIPVHLEGWVLEAERTFRGLQCSSGVLNNSILVYKSKPDCILLINPDLTQIRECKKLNIPLCILNDSLIHGATGNRMQCNRDNCFLTYLVLCVLNYIRVT